MIFSDFEKWLEENDSIATRANFNRFFLATKDIWSEGQLMEYLAWQVCQLQVCVEGLLEDQE